MIRPISRHENREARVIPIILRPCDWTSAPFGKLQALSIAYRAGAKAVTAWDNLDEALSAISQGIRKIAEEMQREKLTEHKPKQQENQNAITIKTVERLIIMSDKPPIFNQQHATIGVNYAAEGSTIEFTQQVNSSEQNFDVLLTDYQSFISELQHNHPNVANVTAASQIIEVEAKRIEAQDQHRWQNFLNLKRLWNGSKKAGVKVGEHFAENNVWAKGGIAFLEGISEDTK